jgi:HK97 family phage portal protein
LARSLDIYRPSRWQRLKRALQFYRAGDPRWDTKRSPFIWPDFRTGQPLWQVCDYQSYVEEGYNLNAVIYSAIQYKARAVLGAPLRAYAGDPDQPEVLPPDHELTKLLTRPNTYQTGGEFMMVNTIYFNIAGETFVHMDRPARGGLPTAMRPLRPDRVKIIPDGNGGLRGYLYLPENRSWLDGVPLLPQDVMHVKLPNPLDPLEGMGHGLSPISPLAQSADVDNQVTRYLKTFFERGTMTNIILKFNVPMDDVEIARVRERWGKQYGGVESWTKPGVLDDSGDVKQLGLTFDQMGFGPIDERNESRQLAPFGVPPILVGTRYGLARSTDTNYKNARAHFWEDTFLPELQLYEPNFDYYLTGEDVSLIVRFDTSQVPALQKDIAQQIDGAYKLWQMGTPANTAVKVVGLQVPAIPGGDTGYLPLNLVPVGSAPALPAAQTTTPATQAEEPAQDEGTEGEVGAEGDTRKSIIRPFRTRPQVGPVRGGQATSLAGRGQDGDELGGEVQTGG